MGTKDCSCPEGKSASNSYLINLTHASICPCCCYSNNLCGVYFMQNGKRLEKKTKVICILLCIKIEMYVC